MKRNLLLNSCNLLTLIFFGALMVFTGCKKDASTPATPQQQSVAVPPAKPIQKIASSALKLPPPAVNQFDFSTKKDPFKPYIVVKVASKSSQNDIKKPLKDSLPILSFDVSQFKLIGLIADPKGSKAMIVDPNGKGYVLKVGMAIGKNEGKVTSINTAGVEILEQFKDDNGRVRKEHIKLTLPRKQ